MNIYLVEIFRYGNEKETHFYGIFNISKEDIHKMMIDYNIYRGGKYPKYKLTTFILNEEMPFETSSLIIDAG